MKMKNWLFGWGIAGLVAPLLDFAIYFSTGYKLGEGIFVLWPGSIGLMVLENRPPVQTVVLIYICLILSNALLYGMFGLLLWPLTRVKSPGVSEDEERKIKAKLKIKDLRRPRDRMSFSDFHGNTETVHRLRDMLARGRFPHAVIISGARGSGKYTLALMLAQALNCLNPTQTDGLPDFCGQCANCRRIAQSADLDARFAEAVEVREGLRETDKKETRLFVQTHPDVLIIPPDPPQMMIKMDQVRRVIETIYYRPSEARERVYIFTDSAFMKEAANSLLKVLEEPPDFATIFLLSENSGELLPTIRSRAMVVPLSALSVEEVEQYLAKHRPEWKAPQRALVARLSEGALGRAGNFDLESYVAARADALAILNSALLGGEHTPLFKITESYRAGAEGREKTEQLLRTLYSLLRDLMFLGSGTPELVQNTDIQSQLTKMAEAADFDWIAAASDRLAEVERGMRRNLLRSLSLDAFGLALAKA